MAPRRSSVQHHQQPQQPQPLQQYHPHHQTQLQEHESLHHHQQQLQLQQHQQLLTTTASTFYNHNDDDENNSNIIIISNNDSNRSNLLSSNNIMSPMQTSNSTNNHQSNNNHKNEQFTRCCYPNGECFKVDTVITFDDFSDCVRVICNNENCNVGQYMHRECFESWEQTVQVYLKSTGRARSWSDRQRSQNLWTKKGYDLVYKACGCKCGRGHIRKDLEWTPTPVSVTVLKNGGGGTATTNGVNGGNFSNGTAVITTNGANTNGGQQRLVNGNGGSSSSNGGSVNVNPNDEEDKKKKKKRNRNNQKPALALAPLNPNGYHTNSQQLQQQQQQQQQQQSQQQQQQNGHTTNGIAVVSNGNANSVSNGITNNCSQIVVSSNNANVANNSSNNNNISPNPNVGVIGSGLHHNSNSLQQQQQQLAPQAQQQQQQQQQQQSVVPSLSNIMSNGNILGLNLRARAGSLSSSAGSGTTSPSASQSSGDICISPIHQQHLHLHQQQQNLQLQQYQQNLMQNGLTKSILNSVNGSCVAASNGVGVVGTNALLTAATKQQQQMQHQQPPTIIGNGNNNTGLKHLNIFDQQHLVQQQKNKEVELYSERVRSTSGCNGIFSRRLDFSSFNLLPKTRLNSYQVKIEDEGNHGNDETRLFILSSLAQSQMSRVACILCEEPMLVFDRYPLVDGSFFLSPRQHSAGCIEVKYDGRALYLTCVCMTCLDGTASNRIISCRFCGELWDGSNLVLGTMYAYDIFAAMPCCAERLKCNNCFKLLLHPQQRLNFYSDYSHCVTCPYCATQDTHFVKPLSYCYTKSNATRLQQIA